MQTTMRRVNGSEEVSGAAVPPVHHPPMQVSQTTTGSSHSNRPPTFKRLLTITHLPHQPLITNQTNQTHRTQKNQTHQQGEISSVRGVGRLTVTPAAVENPNPTAATTRRITSDTNSNMVQPMNGGRVTSPFDDTTNFDQELTIRLHKQAYQKMREELNQLIANHTAWMNQLHQHDSLISGQLAETNERIRLLQQQLSTIQLQSNQQHQVWMNERDEMQQQWSDMNQRIKVMEEEKKETIQHQPPPSPLPPPLASHSLTSTHPTPIASVAHPVTPAVEKKREDPMMKPITTEATVTPTTSHSNTVSSQPVSTSTFVQQPTPPHSFTPVSQQEEAKLRANPRYIPPTAVPTRSLHKDRSLFDLALSGLQPSLARPPLITTTIGANTTNLESRGSSHITSTNHQLKPPRLSREEPTKNFITPTNYSQPTPTISTVDIPTTSRGSVLTPPIIPSSPTSPKTKSTTRPKTKKINASQVHTRVEMTDDHVKDESESPCDDDEEDEDFKPAQRTHSKRRPAPKRKKPATCAPPKKKKTKTKPSSKKTKGKVQPKKKRRYSYAQPYDDSDEETTDYSTSNEDEEEDEVAPSDHEREGVDEQVGSKEGHEAVMSVNQDQLDDQVEDQTTKAVNVENESVGVTEHEVEDEHSTTNQSLHESTIVNAKPSSTPRSSSRKGRRHETDRPTTDFTMSQPTFDFDGDIPIIEDEFGGFRALRQRHSRVNYASMDDPLKSGTTSRQQRAHGGPAFSFWGVKFTSPCN